MEIVEGQRFASVGFPIIGAGSGGLGEGRALAVMVDARYPVEIAPLPQGVELPDYINSWKTKA